MIEKTDLAELEHVVRLIGHDAAATAFVETPARAEDLAVEEESLRVAIADIGAFSGWSPAETERSTALAVTAFREKLARFRGKRACPSALAAAAR